ncbi:MAG TPA: zinc metalloprotease [Chitinophagaceae bacterium]|nr:zinc metalloprotease [Chitinophagaceae bacterium]
MKKQIRVFLLLTSVVFFSCQKQENVQINTENSRPSSPSQILGKGMLKEKCASHIVLEQQVKLDPGRGQYLEKLETVTKNYKRSKAPSEAVKYIPVVVHVVLTNSSVVSDDLIQSQLDVLNLDFNAQNQELKGNPYLAGFMKENAGVLGVKFVLAQTIRVNTKETSFGLNDGVKMSTRGGSDAVDPGSKLNIWVCDLGQYYLGYAQFPGGKEWADGVVLDYRAFGIGRKAGYSYYADYALGRTATHEVGHWMNLYHIWGSRYCGTDYVDDTPQHDSPNYYCSEKGHLSACAPGILEQWMNYMDYSGDACLYLFTRGQQFRMEAAAAEARSAYFYDSNSF